MCVKFTDDEWIKSDRTLYGYKIVIKKYVGNIYNPHCLYYSLFNPKSRTPQKLGHSTGTSLYYKLNEVVVDPDNVYGIYLYRTKKSAIMVFTEGFTEGFGYNNRSIIKVRIPKGTLFRRGISEGYMSKDLLLINAMKVVPLHELDLTKEEFSIAS